MSLATNETVRLSLHAGGQTEVWRSKARYRVVVAGRRWGKTLLARVCLISWALTRGPGRYWYVAPTREDAKDIMWGDLKAACHPDWMAEPPRETELALNLTNGAEIRLWSAEKGDTLRGRALKGLVMDEYADMHPRIYHEILLPSLADYRAPALWIGTPKSFNHFHELYLRGQSQADEWSDWQSWQFRSMDNPTMGIAEMVEDARRQLDERTFKQEWEASFEAMSGRAYYAFDRGANVGPVMLDPDIPAAVFFDFNVEPASAGIGQVQGDRICIWRTSQLSHRGGEATLASAMAIRQQLDAAGHRALVRVYGDATGRSAKTTGPSDHAILRRVFAGARWCIGKANPHERDRVAAVNAACRSSDGRRRLRVDPSNEALIADLEQVIYADNGELDKRSNPALTHLSDGLGYWLAREWPVVEPRDMVRTFKASSSDSVPSAVLAARARRRKAMAESIGVEV